MSFQNAGPYQQASGLVQVPVLERRDGTDTRGTSVFREDHVRQCDCRESLRRFVSVGPRMWKKGCKPNLSSVISWFMVRLCLVPFHRKNEWTARRAQCSKSGAGPLTKLTV